MPDVQQTPAPSAASTGKAKRQPNYGEPAAQLADRCLQKARDHSARKLRDRQDWFNLLLYRGGSNQWSIWDGDRYVERGTDPERGGIPSYVPRAVTNVFATKIDGISSILDQTNPAKECGPGTPDDDDRAAAEVAQAALPTLFDEIRYEQDRAQIHQAIALTSLVGYALYFDNDRKHGTDSIVALQCPKCQEFAMPADVEETDFKCPKCGTPMEDAIDRRTGQPIAQEYAKGRLCGKVSHSFEVSLPPGARTIDTTRLPWVATHTRLPLEEVLQRWPKLKGRLQQSSEWAKSPLSGSQYADAMAGLVAPISEQARAQGAGLGPVVVELWHDPIEDDESYFPEGLYVVRVDDQVAVSEPLPYADEEGRKFKNILIRQFRQTPGNTAGKPPADDLAPLQTQRNIVESLVDLSLMHYAAPREYIPLTVTMIDEPTGAPGERIRVRSTDGTMPTIADGKSPAAGLYERLEQIDRKMDEVSKLNAVLAGERPEGDPTLGEIQILQERGMSAFRAPLDELVQFEVEVARMALRIAKQTMWTPRFYKVKGENNRWDVKQFLGADLEGRIDIYIDKASAWPKSPLLQSLRLKEALEMGLLPSPVSQDPELAGKLFSQLDLAGLKPSLDVDRKQIARELDVWKAATAPEQIRPPDPLTQELPLHEAVKKSWLKTEEAEAVRTERPKVYEAMRQHLQQIQLVLNPPAPTAPTGSSVEDLVGQGVLQPAGAEGPGGAGVEDLMAAGVLAPAAGQGAVR